MEEIDQPEKGTEITIVRCTPENIDTVVRIGRCSYKQHYLHIWKDKGGFYMEKNFSRKAVENDLQNPDFGYFLVCFEKQPIGILKIVKDHTLVGYRAAEALEIEKIYIVREAAGKGVGDGVMDFVKDYARKLGKKVIWLNVMDTSPALAFYKKSGFRPVFRYTMNTVDFPPIKEEYRGMTRMKLLL